VSFDAVLFDLDGTLIDTERATIRSAVAAFAAQGITVAPEVFHVFVGVDDATSAPRLRAMFPQLDMAAFLTAWTSGTARQQETEGIPLKPGVAGLLASIVLPVAIVTSSTRDQAARKLRVSGLAARFPVVVTCDDVAAPKPAPDPYLLAAARLGVAPARCLVFEDSDTGARSGTAAGCFVVQVPDVLPTRGAHASIVAPDLETGARRAGLIPGQM
jgi:HAD superfamily hydrolase (TIGR01509 family)